MAIPVVCDCGKQTKVKDELAGKRIKCPACQAALTVPAADQEVSAGPPPARRQPFDSAHDSQEERPRKQSRSGRQEKSNVMLFALFGGGALLLGCCCIGTVVGGFLLLRSNKDKDSTAKSSGAKDSSSNKEGGAPKDKGLTPPFTQTVKLTREEHRDHPFQKGLMVAAKVVKVEFKAGKMYTIDLINPTFVDADPTSPVPFLILQDKDGRTLRQEDDGGDYPNTRMVFKAPSDGEYRIICTTIDANAYADLTLKVSVSK
jgi:hypothetical protein